MKKPFITFKIYPENKSLYFLVVVWPTLAGLRKIAGPRAAGFCQTFRVIRVYPSGDQRNQRMKPLIGSIHFAAKHLRAGIIAHELTHALFGWMSETQAIPDLSTAKKRESGSAKTLRRNSPEERCCYAMGEMYRQTCLELTKRKLI